VDRQLTVVPLREQPDCIPFFARCFEQEWPAWYGPGGHGNAMADLTAFANPAGDLPVGVVARAADGAWVGVAALKAVSLPQFAHLRPWAAAGYVAAGLRRQGIGAALLDGLLAQARRLGFATVYCATATAGSLLQRQRWRLLERATHDGKPIAIYAIDVALPG
jgi:GNAT superfamily N-acetyltransferase